MTDIDARIRHAYGPTELDADAIARGWDELAFEGRQATLPPPRRRAGARAPRVLIAIAALVVSVSSIAIAQTGTIQDFITSEDRSKAADRMQVFQEEPVGLAGLPDSTKQLFGMLPNGSLSPGYAGPIDPDELRAALRLRTRTIDLDLRSAPSEDGQACMYFTLRVFQRGTWRDHSGGGGCSLAMRYNGHVTVSTMGDIRMGRLTVGLADDAVRQVRVKLSDGRVVPARKGSNGFALHIADPKIQARGLLVDLRDGTTLDVAMNGCLRSQLDPPPKSRLGCGFGMNRGPATPPR
jgi:hypothetical protein